MKACIGNAVKYINYPRNVTFKSNIEKLKKFKLKF